MIPFKISYKLRREILKRPLFYSLINAVLDELEWQNTKRRWKKEMAIWDKIKEHGKKIKGKTTYIKLNIK